MPSRVCHIPSILRSTCTAKQLFATGQKVTTLSEKQRIECLHTAALSPLHLLNWFHKGWHAAPTLWATLCDLHDAFQRLKPATAGGWCAGAGRSKEEGGREVEGGQRQREAKSKGLLSIQISQFPVLCHQVLRSSFGLCHELHAHLRAHAYTHSERGREGGTYNHSLHWINLFSFALCQQCSVLCCVRDLLSKGPFLSAQRISSPKSGHCCLLPLLFLFPRYKAKGTGKHWRTVAWTHLPFGAFYLLTVVDRLARPEKYCKNIADSEVWYCQLIKALKN